MIVPVTACLVLASLQTPARAYPAYATPLRDQVTLALTSDRSGYYVKEPISLKLTLRNAAGRPVVGMFLVGLLSPKVELRYRRNGESFKRFPYPGEVNYFAPPETLEPDGEITDEMLLGYDPARQEFLLPAPGQYEFQAIYADAHPAEASGLVESNILTIEAQMPPAREHDALRSYSTDLARVAQFDPTWATAANRALALAGWGVSVATMMRAARFLDDYPDSAYAPRIRNGLMWALENRLGRSPGSVTVEEKALYERLKGEKPERP